ncbi:MAG: hypothetical protein O2992_00015 [Gemmatimonadetes bacterium]|nr:hypothetical protein [Gemmatimonadota bacterium]
MKHLAALVLLASTLAGMSVGGVAPPESDGSQSVNAVFRAGHLARDPQIAPAYLDRRLD